MSLVRVDLLSLARLDLVEIWEFIADDSERQADRFIEASDEKFLMLARAPLMGRARPELGPAIRSFPFGRYMIFYRPTPDGIEVVRVLHSARDIGSELVDPQS